MQPTEANVMLLTETGGGRDGGKDRGVDRRRDSRARGREVRGEVVYVYT